MRPKEIDRYFDIRVETPVRMAVEASEDNWPGVMEMVMDLMERLHGRVEGLYFLGSEEFRKTFALEFEKEAPSWRRSALNRACLLNPILEPLEKEDWRGIFLVITHRPPIDLGDWLTGQTDLEKRLIFVNMGNEALGAEDMEIAGAAGAAAVCNLCENPPESILIKGAGFFPLQADINNGALSPALETRQNEVLLEIPCGQPRLSLHLKALALENTEPELIITRSKGDTERLTGRDERSWFAGPEWRPVPDEARDVIEAGIKGNSFTCAHCGRTHRGRTLECPEGGVLIQGIPSMNAVLFRSRGGKIDFFSLTGRLAFALDHNRCVLTSDGKVFEWDGHVWRFSRKVAPFEEVNGNGQAIWAVYP